MDFTPASGSVRKLQVALEPECVSGVAAFGSYSLHIAEKNGILDFQILDFHFAESPWLHPFDNKKGWVNLYSPIES